MNNSRAPSQEHLVRYLQYTMVPTVGDSNGIDSCELSLNTVKSPPNYLSYRFLLCLGDNVGSHIQIKVGLSVHQRRLTFIFSAALKCTHGLKVCRYAMKPAWKERTHTRAMNLFIFPQPSSWFFQEPTKLLLALSFQGQDLCSHTHTEETRVCFLHIPQSCQST